MPKPANGRYRLTQVSPPPVPPQGPWVVRVTDGGMYCFPFFWENIPGTGTFTLAPGMGLECTGEGSYIATGPGGPITGTCEYLGV